MYYSISSNAKVHQLKYLIVFENYYIYTYKLSLKLYLKVLPNKLKRQNICFNCILKSSICLDVWIV